jgi:hypothetical protein
LIAVLTAALCGSAAADDITDQLDGARQSYEEGEFRAAVQTLQFVVASIQEKINQSLLGLLPEPPEGWSADDPLANSSGVAAMIAGTTLSRRYYRDDGAEAEVTITADSPFLAMMTMMLSNPMMMQTDPSTRIYTYAGRRGMIKHERDQGTWEISLMAAGNVLVQVTASGVQRKEAAEVFVEAIDLEAVEKAFSG